MNTKPTIATSITLDHDDGVVRAQSWLKGKVVIKVEERMFLEEGVTVELKGKEQTHIPHNCMSWPCQTVNEHIVFSEERMIHDFVKRPLEPGTHSFPFTFYLAASLPPTMLYEEEDECLGCSVDYVLTARVGETFGAERKIKVVGATLSSKVYPHLIQPKFFPFSSWLIDQGYLVLGVRMENSHVGKGRSLDVSLTSRNKSKQEIERVEVQVIEQIDWKTNTHQKERRCIPIVDIPNAVLPGIMTETENGTLADGREQAEVDGLMYAEMHGDLNTAGNLMQLRIPTWARHSYAGKLVKVSHYLKVTPFSKGRAKDPVIKVPIVVFDPPIESALHSSPKPKPKQSSISWPAEIVAQHLHSSDVSCSATSATSLHEIEE